MKNVNYYFGYGHMLGESMTDPKNILLSNYFSFLKERFNISWDIFSTVVSVIPQHHFKT